MYVQETEICDRYFIAFAFNNGFEDSFSLSIQCFLLLFNSHYQDILKHQLIFV